MAVAAASCFNNTCFITLKPNSSISTTNFPLSFSYPIFNGWNGISVTRIGFSSKTYAKFEKFQDDPSEANVEDITVSSLETQEQTIEEEEEDDRFNFVFIPYWSLMNQFDVFIYIGFSLMEFSCLPSDLEGAVRQSGEASALFVSSGGMRAIVCAN